MKDAATNSVSMALRYAFPCAVARCTTGKRFGSGFHCVPAAAANAVLKTKDAGVSSKGICRAPTTTQVCG
jgi:hypothetical protein